MTGDVSTPKVFISYSRSSNEFVDRVVKLAEHLVADGILVVLDQWDLREGQDKHQFMEKAVNDPEITRVLILCDPLYASKANSRDAGVGTETLIISPEVYRQANQEKFIPVILERDAEGRVVVPTYLDGRIYIDLSDPSKEDQEYQRLVRNFYGRPEMQRPPLGQRPAYLDETATVLVTGRSAANFKEAIASGRPNQVGLFSEYLRRLGDAFAAEAIEPPKSFADLDESVVRSIDGFLPYRDEFIDVALWLAQYGEQDGPYERLHGFFEHLVNTRYGTSPKHWQHGETENLDFLSWEMFLYAVAALIRERRFDKLLVLTSAYYVHSGRTGTGALRSMDVLDPGFPLLDEHRKKRLALTPTSVSVKMLRDRATHAGIPFQAVMEADVLLWLRSVLIPDDSKLISGPWYPRTLHYAENVVTLPLFVRAMDNDFFRKLAPILGVTDRGALATHFANLPDDAFFSVGRFGQGRSRYARLVQVTPRPTQ